MMPGENGLDLTRAIRTQTQTPILMLTARTEAEDRIAGLEHLSAIEDHRTEAV